MKKFLFVLAVIAAHSILSLNAAALVVPAVPQVVVAAPPAAVAKSFISIFGNLPVQQWKLRSDGNWRAHFLRNGIAWEATFTSAGTLVKSEPAK